MTAERPRRLNEDNVWAASDLIKGLWLFRQFSASEPRVWWDQHELVVFVARAPAAMDAGAAWQLSELRWVYVENSDRFGEPYWTLRVSGG